MNFYGEVNPATYENENGYYLTLDINDSSCLRTDPIGANGERYVKVVLTKNLSSNVKNDNTKFSDTAEILNYTNKMGIRMQKSYKGLNNLENKIAVIPGNSVEGDRKSIAEPDYTKSVKVVVIPPTGKEINIIIASITFVMFLIAVFIFNSGKLKLRKKSKNE